MNNIIFGCLDAEYRIDDKHNPIPTEKWNEQSKDVRKYVKYN